MKYKIGIGIVTMFLICVLSQGRTEPVSSVRMIRNGGTEVGILSEVGGRVVILRRTGGNNVLKAVPGLWELPLSGHPKPDGEKPSMIPYLGQIVWVGPQGEWWMHQTVNPRLKQMKSQWPPDPYLIYGDYRIIGRTDSSIVMQGPGSPVSGLQLTKTIMVDAAGRVHFQVAAKNIREIPVRWDLWFNMRTPGFTRFYVPVMDTADIRIEFHNGGSRAINWSVEDGFFTFFPELPEAGRKTAKAFIFPREGWIAGFQKDLMILILFDRQDRKQIHPDQGHVEIYQDLMPDPAGALLELEHHDLYGELGPGESRSARETWELHPFEGEMSGQAQRTFLNSVLESRH
ncbi:DUF4380 domain-containing protein [bacterium]|nr:DUF4380 domain-containing protein [bacterium]